MHLWTVPHRRDVFFRDNWTESVSYGAEVRNLQRLRLRRQHR